MKCDRSTWKKLSFSAIFASILIGAGIFYYLSVPCGPVCDFNYERDASAILKTFDRDWYWLVESDDYSPAYTLKYRTPDRNPLHFGRLRIKVLREDNTYAGFIAYYMVTTTLGKILFLAIEPEFRGRRLSDTLMRYALNDLIRMGAKRITLVTRTTNIPAQRVYNRVGFKEIVRDDEGFVYFEYTP